MSNGTTTLKMSAELKARVAEIARATGTTPHAFMLSAIEAETALAERRAAMVGDALLAEQEVVQYGLVHDGDEVLSYVRDRLEGREPIVRPRTRSR